VARERTIIQRAARTRSGQSLGMPLGRMLALRARCWTEGGPYSGLEPVDLGLNLYLRLCGVSRSFC